MQDQGNPPPAIGPMVHCRVGRAIGGDRIAVYVGRSADRLHLAGIIWTDPEDTRELVQRLQEPGYQAEWSSESPGTIPRPATADDPPNHLSVVTP